MVKIGFGIRIAVVVTATLMACRDSDSEDPNQTPAPTVTTIAEEDLHPGQITLRVILYGLIATTSISDGHDMRALLVRADHHYTIIGTLNTKCSPVDMCGGRGDRLEWRFDEDDKVMITFGDGISQSHITDPPFKDLCKIPPESPRPGLMNKFEKLTWIPCMKHIHSSYDQLYRPCRGDSIDDLKDCRFAKAGISFGENRVRDAGVCHFSHKDLDGNSEYAYYDFINEAFPTDRKRWNNNKGRVIGDAIMVKFNLEGSSYKLAAKFEADNDSREVSLSPVNSVTEIDLIISNYFRPPEQDSSVETSRHEHFSRYYSVIDPRVRLGAKYIPDFRITAPKFSGIPSYCDEKKILDDFEEEYNLNAIQNGQHNQRECDMIAFSGN